MGEEVVTQITRGYGMVWPMSPGGMYGGRGTSHPGVCIVAEGCRTPSGQDLPAARAAHRSVDEPVGGSGSTLAHELGCLSHGGPPAHVEVHVVLSVMANWRQKRSNESDLPAGLKSDWAARPEVVLAAGLGLELERGHVARKIRRFCLCHIPQLGTVLSHTCFASNDTSRPTKKTYEFSGGKSK